MNPAARAKYVLKKKICKDIEALRKKYCQQIPSLPKEHHNKSDGTFGVVENRLNQIFTELQKYKQRQRPFVAASNDKIQRCKEAIVRVERNLQRIHNCLAGSEPHRTMGGPHHLVRPTTDGPKTISPKKKTRKRPFQETFRTRSQGEDVSFNKGSVRLQSPQVTDIPDLEYGDMTRKQKETGMDASVKNNLLSPLSEHLTKLEEDYERWKQDLQNIGVSYDGTNKNDTIMRLLVLDNDCLAALGSLEQVPSKRSKYSFGQERQKRREELRAHCIELQEDIKRLISVIESRPYEQRRSSEQIPHRTEYGGATGSWAQPLGQTGTGRFSEVSHHLDRPEQSTGMSPYDAGTRTTPRNATSSPQSPAVEFSGMPHGLQRPDQSTGMSPHFAATPTTPRMTASSPQSPAEQVLPGSVPQFSGVSYGFDRPEQRTKMSPYFAGTHTTPRNAASFLHSPAEEFSGVSHDLNKPDQSAGMSSHSVTTRISPRIAASFPQSLAEEVPMVVSGVEHSPKAYPPLTTSPLSAAPASNQTSAISPLTDDKMVPKPVSGDPVTPDVRVHSGMAPWGDDGIAGHGITQPYQEDLTASPTMITSPEAPVAAIRGHMSDVGGTPSFRSNISEDIYSSHQPIDDAIGQAVPPEADSISMTMEGLESDQITSREAPVAGLRGHMSDVGGTPSSYSHISEDIYSSNQATDDAIGQAVSSEADSISMTMGGLESDQVSEPVSSNVQIHPGDSGMAPGGDDGSIGHRITQPYHMDSTAPPNMITSPEPPVAGIRGHMSDVEGTPSFRSNISEDIYSSNQPMDDAIGQVVPSENDSISMTMERVEKDRGSRHVSLEGPVEPLQSAGALQNLEQRTSPMEEGPAQPMSGDVRLEEESQQPMTPVLSQTTKPTDGDENTGITSGVKDLRLEGGEAPDRSTSRMTTGSRISFPVEWVLKLFCSDCIPASRGVSMNRSSEDESSNTENGDGLSMVPIKDDEGIAISSIPEESIQEEYTAEGSTQDEYIPEEYIPEETGVLFHEDAELMYLVEGEWQSQGKGQLTISQQGGACHISFQTDQPERQLLASHEIKYDLILMQMKGEDRVFTWTAEDYSRKRTKAETITFAARFGDAETAGNFQRVFNGIKKNLEELKRAQAPQKKSSGFLDAIPKTFSFGSSLTLPSLKSGRSTVGSVKSLFQNKGSVEWHVEVAYLKHLSSRISGGWREIGANLGLTNEKLSVIRGDFDDSHDQHEAAYQMLMYWLLKNKSKATRDILSQALNSSGRGDLAETEAGGLDREDLPVIAETEFLFENFDALVQFSEAAELFHREETSWESRGKGKLTIFQNVRDLKMWVIFTARDVAGFISAYHKISKDAYLLAIKEEDRAFTWTVMDCSENSNEPQKITFCAMFSDVSTANHFSDVFKEAQNSPAVGKPDKHLGKSSIVGCVQLFRKLSGAISSRAEKVGKHLNISRDVMELLRTNHEYDRVLFQTLYWWRLKNDPAGTHSRLAEALKKAGRLDLSDYVLAESRTGTSSSEGAGIG